MIENYLPAVINNILTQNFIALALSIFEIEVIIQTLIKKN